MLMLLQQKYSMKFTKTVSFHWKDYGLKGIFRGLGICSVRDSIYTTAYLGFAPWLSEYCRAQFADYPVLARHDHWLPFFLAGPTGGLVAALLTQPLDTVKTYQQASPHKVSVSTAFSKIVAADGWRGLYSGLVGRAQRISMGVVVLSMVNEKVQHSLQLRRYHSERAKSRTRDE
jgi:hypothetical protein